MKHLRKIFESVEETEEDLRDIFNDYLRDEDDEPDLRDLEKTRFDAIGQEMSSKPLKMFSRVQPYHDVSNMPGKYISIKIEF